MEANGTRPEPVVLQRERIGEPRKTAEKLCENCTFHKQLESCLYCMKDQPLSDVEPKDLVFTEENDDKQRTFSNPHDRICFPPNSVENKFVFHRVGWKTNSVVWVGKCALFVIIFLGKN